MYYNSIYMLALCFLILSVSSFTPTNLSVFTIQQQQHQQRQEHSTIVLFAEGGGDSNDSNQVVGKRIIVKGDVNGGYVRTCIQNEASRFRKLIGTMSPPDETSDTAEIYVEGKLKNIEGFLRWCSKGSAKVGLSQKLEVLSVSDEVPTGLYDDFYVKTKKE